MKALLLLALSLLGTTSAECADGTCGVGSSLLATRASLVKKSVVTGSDIDSGADLDYVEADGPDDDEDDEGKKPDMPPVLEGGLSPHPDLAVALPIVVINLTNYSGMIEAGTSTPSHTFGDVTADKALLLDMVAGFFNVLHDHLRSKKSRAFCPKGDISVIRKCVKIAICLLQDDVGRTNFSIASYTLYEETVARFDAISWDLIVSSLEEEGKGAALPDSFGIPESTSCDSTYQWLYDDIRKKAANEDDSKCADLAGTYTSSSLSGDIVVEQIDCMGTMTVGGAEWEYTVKGKKVTFPEMTAKVTGSYANYIITLSTGEVLKQLQLADPDEDNRGQSLAQVTAEKTETLAAALRLSAVLNLAFQGTHHILDSHHANSSMAATVQQLELAWEPFCTAMKCDHTNYYDMFGATHVHSLALIEAGASAQHMRSHVRNRLGLENRMQRFLADYGEQGASQVYRDAGDAVLQSMQRYASRGRRDTMQFISRYVESEENAAKLVGWVSSDNYRAHLIEHGFIEDTASHEDSLIQQDASDQSDWWGRRRRRRRRSSRRRWWHRFTRSVGNVVKKVAKTVVKVVKAVGHFVGQLFKCFGHFSTMVAVGYCRKFVPPTKPFVGIGISLSAQRTLGLGNILKGFAPSQGVRVVLSAVFGAVPGTPVTGGLRAGVGMGVSFGCVAGKTCEVGLSVGATASALVPTYDPKCVAGAWFAGFRCMVAAGVAVSAACCKFDVVTGKSSCR